MRPGHSHDSSQSAATDLLFLCGQGNACPVCGGTGQTECPCGRWRADGEGCDGCGYTNRTICMACRGGGQGRRLLARVAVTRDQPL